MLTTTWVQFGKSWQYLTAEAVNNRIACFERYLCFHTQAHRDAGASCPYHGTIPSVHLKPEREIAVQLEACLKMLFASKVSRGLKVAHSNRPVAIKNERGRGGGTINQIIGRCRVPCTLTSTSLSLYSEENCVPQMS